MGTSLAVLLLLLGLWLWQVLPEPSSGRWEAGEMRGWIPGQSQKKAGDTDQATQLPKSPEQDHREGRAGQAQCLSTAYLCPCQYFILATNPVSGALLTSLQRGQRELGEGKYQASECRVLTQIQVCLAHALSTTLCWVSVIWELVNGLRFSSLEDF